MRFGLIHAAFRPYSPGYVEPDFRERGARDYRLDATLDLDEFTAAIICIVHHYNNEHLLAEYDRDPAMIADEVRDQSRSSSGIGASSGGRACSGAFPRIWLS